MSGNCLQHMGRGAISERASPFSYPSNPRGSSYFGFGAPGTAPTTQLDKVSSIQKPPSELWMLKHEEKLTDFHAATTDSMSIDFYFAASKFNLVPQCQEKAACKSIKSLLSEEEEDDSCTSNVCVFFLFCPPPPSHPGCGKASHDTLECFPCCAWKWS